MENNPDAAFVAFDKETLKPIEGDEPYKTTSDSEASLAWTPEETVCSSTTDEGYRWCRAQSFFSDGELIYTLVAYRERGKTSKIKRIVLEIYEIEGKGLNRAQEVVLFKNDGETPFIGKASRTDEHYLMKGSIACNGAVLIWHSMHRWHMFDVVTGTRFKKEHMNSTSLISTYDAKDNYYFHMDAACYSWLKRWKISGFKPRVLGSKIKKMVELPVVFD